MLGPQTYHRLPEMVARAARAGGAVIETDFPAEEKFDFLPEAAGAAGGDRLPDDAGGLRQVLHLLRGALYPRRRTVRPAAAVLAEAQRLAGRQGAREITLLGQNVNAWHGEGAGRRATWGLGRLLRELAELPGLLRLRYTTSHPRDMDDELIAAHRDLPTLMPYLHLPVQSGSDRVLAAMNRQHGGRISCAWSSGCARPGPTSPCRPTSSSAIRARPSRLRRDHGAGAAGGLRHGL